ncbi:hypothetical protein GCM10012275_33150 [Longimycelium tulufanense]|uniref:Uncharacterized protein n=1 Tax=Longimycelium tulufanense TaxID=907463 RepID=A0A8J3CCL0_9PSEU|nr:hypothetical protein [Longimycelium tulufanense]GGM59360.1 hypothetical protein GCM10012275_33150 [Longimycelium tulufanense]
MVATVTLYVTAASTTDWNALDLLVNLAWAFAVSFILNATALVARCHGESRGRLLQTWKSRRKTFTLLGCETSFHTLFGIVLPLLTPILPPVVWSAGASAMANAVGSAGGAEGEAAAGRGRNVLSQAKQLLYLKLTMLRERLNGQLENDTMDWINGQMPRPEDDDSALRFATQQLACELTSRVGEGTEKGKKVQVHLREIEKGLSQYQPEDGSTLELAKDHFIRLLKKAYLWGHLDAVESYQDPGRIAAVRLTMASLRRPSRQ